MKDRVTHFKIKNLVTLGETPEIEFYGLFVTGREGRRKIVVPLAEVEVNEEGENILLVEDYNTWFWNYR